MRHVEHLTEVIRHRIPAHAGGEISLRVRAASRRIVKSATQLGASDRASNVSRGLVRRRPARLSAANTGERPQGQQLE